LKLRSFLAFDIPKEVKAKLKNLIADFSAKEERVKWVNPENMHVTLKFFGDVEEDLLIGDISKSIESSIKGHGSFKLSCQGIGVFPNWKYPRVIWAGLVGETVKVIDLQASIESGLEKFDIKKDNREFRVHLTLGRAKTVLKKSPIVELAQSLGPYDFGKVEISELVLYKSQLTKSGPIYTSLKKFRL